MTRFFGMGLSLAALAAMAGPALAAPTLVPAVAHPAMGGPRRKKRKAALVNATGKVRRSRAIAAPRRKRPNRLHIGKRVRRKHRRAA